MDLKAWYLDHSGFAVEAGEHLLLFDYTNNQPENGTLADGVISPESFAGRPVTVFSSHRHSDHFSRCILNWPGRHPDLLLVLSDDIAARGDGILPVSAGQTIQVRPDITVRTLASTDEGVAFLVITPAGTVYHAGDLNWWHWNGESDDYNRVMGENYQTQIDLLSGQTVDLAFVPVDPRLEDKYAWGADYWMRTVGARRLVPMHLWGKYEICEQLRQEPCAVSYRDAIAIYSHRGERVDA